ncbi:hypothetical protein Sipo7851_17925 [Streptomyces ipomoeae]|nr:hypothetical protein Sipo7851_17925 [Streptomyces ipomoeae]
MTFPAVGSPAPGSTPGRNRNSTVVIFCPRREMSQTDPLPAFPTPRQSKLVRGLNLLNCFGTDDMLRLSQLAERAGVPLPTAHRLVNELERWGMLERVGDHLRLGQKLALLGRRAQSHLQSLLDEALPTLVRLQNTTGFDIMFSACYGSQALPIGLLSRRGDTTVISYAPRGSALNSLLVEAAMRQHDSGSAAPRLITHGDVTGVGVAVRPRGTAVRAVIALVGHDRDAVAAVVPHVQAVARWLTGQLETPVPLASEPPEREPCPDTPSMLARGLSLLNGLRAGETRVTLSELAARTGLPKSTAHRLISVLIDYQFLQDGGAGIMFGPRLLALSAQVPSRRLLRASALPWQRLLCEQSGGFSCLVVPDPPVLDRLACVCADGTVATAIDRDAAAPTERLSSAAAWAALRQAGGSMGPCGLFTKDLDEPTQPLPAVAYGQGYAVATVPGGLTALAVPVVTGAAAPGAALTLVMRTPRRERLRAALRTARDAATDISRACEGLSAGPRVGLVPTQLPRNTTTRPRSPARPPSGTSPGWVTRW